MMKDEGKHTYEGEWVNSVQHGVGIEKFTNGDTFEGNYDLGKKKGHGKMYYKALDANY